MYNQNVINSANQPDVPQEVIDMEQKAEKKNTTAKLTAYYCRLSKDDGNTDDSSSIQTQKAMLTKFGMDRGYWNTKFYVDDGYSGTNFNRPAFQQMLEDIKAGKIERVITKDLSRLGRNYLETGSLIDVVFPNYHVHYIAITDGVDSNVRQSMDMTAFKNIINDLYSADISRKIKAARKARAESGMFTASVAPYGYMKDPNDNHHLVIVEERAAIVRQIYKWCIEGQGVQHIRNRLRKMRIPRPGACAVRDYEYTGSAEGDPCQWSNNSVRSILSNPTYVGHLVSGRRPSISMKSNKREYHPYSECIVVYNTHEGIVSQEDFDLVQTLIKSRKRRVHTDSLDNIFAGLIKCADCGYAMSKMRANRPKRKNIIDCYTYACNLYRTEGRGKNGVRGCTQHKLEARDLFDTVLNDIRSHAQKAVMDDEAFLESLVKKMSGEKKSEQKQLHAKAKKARRRLEELDTLYEKLYEDRAAGAISERNFTRLSAKYEQEQEELEKLIAESENAKKESNADTRNAEEFIKTIREYAEITELDAAVLNRLIDRITVCEAEEVDGEMRQKITIYYKFIGSLDQ